MDKVEIYCCAAGKESGAILKNIPDEVRGINFQLRSIEHCHFSQQIHLADLVIIAANLNEPSEFNNVELMVNTANKYKVPTVIYALYSLRICPIGEERETWLAQLDNIRKKSPLIVLDEVFINKSSNKQFSSIQHYSIKGLDILAIQLIFGIRAISDPMLKQEVVGVDFADYRLAFDHKGFYQVKFLNHETLFQSKLNNENWLQANVLIITIFLKQDNAINVFSKISAAISNMLEGGNPFWLCTVAIDEQVKNEPMISIIYKT